MSFVEQSVLPLLLSQSANDSREACPCNCTDAQLKEFNFKKL